MPERSPEWKEYTAHHKVWIEAQCLYNGTKSANGPEADSECLRKNPCLLHNSITDSKSKGDNRLKIMPCEPPSAEWYLYRCLPDPEAPRGVLSSTNLVLQALRLNTEERQHTWFLRIPERSLDQRDSLFALITLCSALRGRLLATLAVEKLRNCNSPAFLTK